MQLEDYVEVRDPDSMRIRGHRIEVEHVIDLYHEGFSPEAIAQEFPTLSLEAIYATITYYLHHQTAVDQYMARRKAAATQLSQAADQQPAAPVIERLRARRAAQQETPHA